MGEFLAVGRPVIESLCLVERYRRQTSGKPFVASTLPGHLIHLVISGRAEQTSNGRRQELSPGTLVWYHEDEWVEGRAISTPWVFYSVSFTAPALVPPDFELRLRRGCQRLKSHFHRLWETWRSPDSPRRTYLCQSHLLALLSAVEASSPAPDPSGASLRPWWEFEAWLRRNISSPISMADVCRHFHCSPKTVERACHAALGQPPMKRLKHIRLSLARGLVQFSELNMTEIARRVGYARVHEFSRDYHKAFSQAPTAERKAWRGEEGNH